MHAGSNGTPLTQPAKTEELESNEEDPINTSILRPYSVNHRPNPPIAIPTRIITNTIYEKLTD